MRKTGKEQDNEAVKAQVSQPGSLGVLCCVLCYQSQKPISNKIYIPKKMERKRIIFSQPRRVLIRFDP
jgi:hypothetical protein